MWGDSLENNPNKQVAVLLGACCWNECDEKSTVTWLNSKGEEIPVCQKCLEKLLYVHYADEIEPGIWKVKRYPGE